MVRARGPSPKHWLPACCLAGDVTPTTEPTGIQGSRYFPRKIERLLSMPQIIFGFDSSSPRVAAPPAQLEYPLRDSSGCEQSTIRIHSSLPFSNERRWHEPPLYSQGTLRFGKCITPAYVSTDIDNNHNSCSVFARLSIHITDTNELSRRGNACELYSYTDRWRGHGSDGGKLDIKKDAPVFVRGR